MGEPQSAVRALLGRAPDEIVPLTDLNLPAKDRRKGQWYGVHPTVWEQVRGVPGIQFLSSGVPIVHRSMLPLVRNFLPDAKVNHEKIAILDDDEFDQRNASLGWKLRPYQHVARRRLRSYKRLLLADGMRMGKTIEILSAHELSDGPLVVIAPLATRKVWTDWFQRRWPGEPYVALQGLTFRREDVEGKNLVFMHYNLLTAWQSIGTLPIGRVVLDEAHLISNKKGQWAQAMSIVAGRAECLVEATGTPLWNMPVDLWSALHLLAPGAWGTWTQYAVRYCGGRPGPYGLVCDGATNTEEMRARMSELMLRREWKDVADQLPAIERSVEVLPLNQKEKRQIDAAVESLQSTTDHKTYVGKMAQYRRLLGAVKQDRAVELATELLRAEEPVVLWTWHVDTANAIAAAIEKKGYPAFTLNGKQTQTIRDRNIDAWRNTNGAIVVTLSTGQAGIDLSHARHCIFAELDWTPAVIAQAEMRTWSIARPMTVTYLAVDHDADQDMVNRLRFKLELSTELQIPAADAAIDVIAGAFGGPPQVGDLNRLMLDILSGDDGEDTLF